MEQINESLFDFDINQIEIKRTYSGDIINNYPNEDSSINDSIHLDSNNQEFDIESNFSISKNMEDFINCANSPKSYENLDIFDKEDEQNETFSLIHDNNSILFNENKFNFPESIETSPIAHTTDTKEKSTNNKKVGRKRKEDAVLKKDDSLHDMYSEDNISVKIKSHYLNFIISFLNCIFPHFNYKKKLFNLDKEFKINIKKNIIESLNDKTIGEIISNKISKKYSTIQDKINANKDIYEEIKNEPILNKILAENYLIFFRKFYYTNDSYFNLKDYGLNKKINLTKKVKKFKHLLEKNEDKGEKYIMSVKEYVHRYYLPSLIFIS